MNSARISLAAVTAHYIKHASGSQKIYVAKSLKKTRIIKCLRLKKARYKNDA